MGKGVTTKAIETGHLAEIQVAPTKRRWVDASKLNCKFK